MLNLHLELVATNLRRWILMIKLLCYKMLSEESNLQVSFSSMKSILNLKVNKIYIYSTLAD